MFHHIAIKAILEGRTIRINGDGLQRRSNAYVLDLVDGVVRAMQVPEASGQAFNLGGGESVTLLDTVQIIERLIGKQARLEYGPAQTGDQRVTDANIELARAVLGYEPKTRLVDGLAAQIDWQREAVCV